MIKRRRKEKLSCFILNVGKSHGGSPQALSQSVDVTDPETSNALRLSTVYPTSYHSEALYDQVV